MQEKAVIVEATQEVYHASCFVRVFPSDERRPVNATLEDVKPDDECDYCAAPLMEPPDEDDDDEVDDDPEWDSAVEDDE